MIEIRALTKHFGPLTAVDSVSLRVNRGEVLGFLGPNGAGKSTTMKMVTGFLPPSSGTAIVCGHDVTKDPLSVKRAIGYLPEGAPAYPDMTPETFLRFIAEVRGIRGPAVKARIDEVVQRVHLEGVYRQTIDTLSKGFKRRVGLAQAILHDPEVLILDEPTDGLDPNQKHEVRELIAHMAPSKVIILSTHILEEVDAVCTRAVIINKGKVVVDGTPAQLRARSRHHNAVVLGVKTASANPGTGEAGVRSDLARLPGVASVEPLGVSNGSISLLILPRPSATPSTLAVEVGQFARTKGWEIDELRVQPGKLDEVFRSITTTDTAGRD